MKPLIGLLVPLFTTAALAQSPPKPAKKPAVQTKQQTPLGCKVVGTVRGTKIWAGDCIAAAPAAQDSPAVAPPEPLRGASASAPDEKQ